MNREQRRKKIRPSGKGGTKGAFGGTPRNKERRVITGYEQTKTGLVPKYGKQKGGRGSHNTCSTQAKKA
jgi:hypothetical protein